MAVRGPLGDGRQALVVGVDYGTLSGRAVGVRVSDGAELVLPPLAIARQISDQVNTPTFDLPDLSWAAMIRKLDRIDPSYRD